jgi:hypothetical protein
LEERIGAGAAGVHRSSRAPARAAVLPLLEAPGDGFSITTAADGAYAGDTRHQTLDDAKHQAEVEFGPHYSEWVAVPPDIEGVVAYALAGKDEA